MPLTYLRTRMWAPAARYLQLFFRILRGEGLIWSYIAQRSLFMLRAPFKRASFWFASGGKDLNRFDPLHLSFRSTVGRHIVTETLFLERPTTAVILGFGQSNIANESQASARYSPKGEVYNFNFFDGHCYVAKDPLLGASIDRSNVLTRLGELLVERESYSRVLLVPIAHGGTFASDWSPGGRMFPRLEWTIERLRERRIRLTHILLQQGEAEASTSNPSAEEWVRHFTGMISAIRAAGVDAPIYVAQSTICNNNANEIIRSAQRKVVDPAAGIIPGPDIDMIGRDERYDGCHFSESGLRRAAEMWYEVLSRSN